MTGEANKPYLHAESKFTKENTFQKILKSRSAERMRTLHDNPMCSKDPRDCRSGPC